MAVTETKIAVPVPSSTQAQIDNVQVTTGQGAVQRQVTVHGDPEDPNARTKVTGALPAPGAYGTVVRQAPHNLDTGRLLLSAAFVQVVVGTVEIALMFLSNNSTSTQKVSATDGLDAVMFTDMPLSPGQVLPLKLEGAAWASGVKLKAGNAGLVVAQVVGDQ